MFVFLTVNVVSTLNCSNLITNITIDIDPEPYIYEKISFFATLPQQYRSHDVKCLTYVKSMDDEIYQINPEIIEYSESQIPFFRRKEETRDFFTAENGVINTYITYRDLVAYTQFVLEVDCVSENISTNIKGQKCITPYYEELKRVGTRGVWVVENMNMLFVLFIVLIIIIGFLGLIYRGGKKLI